MKHRLVLWLFFGFIGIFFINSSPVSAATDAGWSAGMPDARVTAAPATYADTMPSSRPCANETVAVAHYGTGQACITRMSGWRYGTFVHQYYANTMMANETFFIVSIGTDADFYRVDGMPADDSVHSSAGNTIVVHECCKVLAGDGYASYPDFPGYLQRTHDGYELSDKPAVIAHYADGTDVHGFGIGMSQDGRFAAVQTSNGIALVTLTSGVTRMVSLLVPRSDYGPIPRLELAVTNDGDTVFVGGKPYLGRVFSMIDTSGVCGSGSETVAVIEACPIKDLTSLFESTLPMGYPTGLHLSADGQRLDTVIDRVADGYVRASLYPTGKTPSLVRYLALGDSYSSGEGDTGRDPLTGNKYYEAFTDTDGSDGAPVEACHVSSRSYPFILGADMALDAPQFHSVACSGAETKDIVNDDTYEGQGGRLAMLSKDNRQNYNNEALDTFIPGRVPQDRFIERYTPLAASISVGGNDLQFSSIVADCVYSVTTCSYASDPDKRASLGSAISGMYGKLTAVYSQLMTESPSMKLYVIGYPRFVNADALLCPASTNLDHAERQMIDEGTKYLNTVIEAAAASAGAKYVDIGDALLGHRVCDDPGGYVNAIALLDQEKVETFHPNADGHAAMATAIEHALGTADLTAYEYCADAYPCPKQTNAPTVPDYFNDGSVHPSVPAIPTELVPGGVVTQGVEYVIKDLVLAPLSDVRVEIHSSPDVLATSVTDANGAVNVPITVSGDISTGLHELHLYGTSPSGEAIDLVQIVTVRAPDTPDAPVSSTSDDASNNGVTEPTPSGTISSVDGPASRARTANAAIKPNTIAPGSASDAGWLPATRGDLLVVGASLASVVVGTGLIILGRSLGRAKRSN